MVAGNVFRSRITKYYLLFVILPSVLMTRLALLAFDNSKWAVPVIIFFLTPLILFLIAVLARARYVFTESGLRIEEIWSKWEIPYPSIRGAENTTDMFGTVSVIIAYTISPNKTERAFINPSRRDEFIALLSERSPDLRTEINKLAVGDHNVAECDIYRTKISRVYRYGIAFGPCAALLFLLGAFVLRSDHYISEMFIALSAVIFFFVLIFIAVVILSRRNIRYMFTEDGLLIEPLLRSVRKMIRYEAIVTVTEARDLFIGLNNGYGASADLIEIVYESGEATVWISPEKKEEFLTKLSSRLPDPGIVVRYDDETA